MKMTIIPFLVAIVMCTCKYNIYMCINLKLIFLLKCSCFYLCFSLALKSCNIVGAFKEIFKIGHQLISLKVLDLNDLSNENKNTATTYIQRTCSQISLSRTILMRFLEM